VAERQIQTVNWWHERLADMMIAHPEATLGQIARALGRTQQWISTIKNSDTFIDYWRRRSTAHSNEVTQGIKAKGYAAAELALDRLNNKLEGPEGDLFTPDTLLQVIDTTMKRFGYDNAKNQAPVFNFNLGTVTPEQLAEAREKLRRNNEITELKALPPPTEKPVDGPPGDSK
jgi:hypothetical protein